MLEESSIKKYVLNVKNYFVLFLLYSSFSFSQTLNKLPIPVNTRQVILILTDSIKSTSGNLYRFERSDIKSKWSQIGETIPIVLGRNGLAWGRGLNEIAESKLPIKAEGDGKSPAGVFKLGSAFGYAPEEQMRGLKIPYIHITELCECIDDIKSEHYNEIVFRNEIDTVDWQSSEKMFYADIYYELGVIINQNMNPIIRGLGSCIFLHNWSIPDETSSGCTEMEPKNMEEIIYWLDFSANAILVQLTGQLYNDYQQIWELPVIVQQHD
jgi:L,D-peptidoglycan transpeptidase YkuD (ErfK/YbiS/YcfS/YnhG family)